MRKHYGTTAKRTPSRPGYRSWIVRLATIATAIVVAMTVASVPASAQPRGTDQQDLSIAESQRILDQVSIPAKSSSGYAIDHTDIVGWSIPGMVTFVSYGLDAPDDEHRSLIGAYVDTQGNQISTVEAVFTATGLRVWVDGKEQSLAASGDRSEAASGDRSEAPMARASLPSFCELLGLYIKGEVALSSVVIAAGGITALFTGPVGAVVAAAGGVRLAIATEADFIHSMIC